MKNLFYLLALVSTLVFSQQNHDRFKGSLVERYHRAKASQKYAPPGTPFTGRVYYKAPSDIWKYSKKAVKFYIEGAIERNGVWWISHQEWGDHFNVVVKLLACDRTGQDCYQSPNYTQRVWKSILNREGDATGGIWWGSNITYKIGDNRVKSNVYNKFSTMRNGQGKAIMDTRNIRVANQAFNQSTNIAPDGRSMFGYANRKQDRNYEPYVTKGVFRMDKSLIGKTFPIWGIYKDENGKVLFGKKLWVRVY